MLFSYSSLGFSSQIIESQIQRAAEQSKISQSMDIQVRRTALRYETRDISATDKPDMHKRTKSCFITDKQMIPDRLFSAHSSQRLLLRTLVIFFMSFVSVMLQVSIHPFLIHPAYTFEKV